MGYGFAGKIPKHAPHFCNFTVDLYYIFSPISSLKYTKTPNNSETDALSLFISFFLHTCRNCIKYYCIKNSWYTSLLNTPFRDKPPRLSRSGAFIELPALNTPFRDNRGGLSRKGVPVPTPTPFPSRSHSVPTTPPFETSPSG